MMPNLTTPVPAPKLPFRIDFATGIVSLGSCFSDEVGSRLDEGGFHIKVNPFGTLYNPASIAEALQRVLDDRPIVMDDLVKHEDLWHSWYHHGSFSRSTPGATLMTCNSRLHQAHRALKEADLLMITFGSAWIFEREGGKVVANCHKLPAQMFERRRMTVEEIVALWQPLLQKLQTYYPTLQVLFSVSPIRHMADGAHGNQLSKATLLLAIDQLMHSDNQALGQSSIHYFPAYEIVLDELRDYRFYGPDMAHPSDLAVEIVWERFQQATMVPAVRQQAHYNIKQHKREKHIPLH